MPDAITLALVGDVYIDRPDPRSALRHVRPVLDDADYRFANLESIYTDTPQLAPSALLPAYVGTANAAAMLDRPFDVVSLAHNHTLDAGHEAMLQTRQWLEDHGVRTCGAGADIVQARTPATVTVAGRTVACLAYASMMPVGYEARHNWPGIAPMRARNVYEGTPNHWIPGEQPRVRTEPLPEDVEALVADIRSARERADVVIVSFHWGDWTRKFFVSDHEQRTARLAIDAGADIVVGHHHHALRGMDWYRDRPIFYGMGPPRL